MNHSLLETSHRNCKCKRKTSKDFSGNNVMDRGTCGQRNFSAKSLSASEVSMTRTTTVNTRRSGRTVITDGIEFNGMKCLALGILIAVSCQSESVRGDASAQIFHNSVQTGESSMCCCFFLYL